MHNIVPVLDKVSSAEMSVFVILNRWSRRQCYVQPLNTKLLTSYNYYCILIYVIVGKECKKVLQSEISRNIALSDCCIKRRHYLRVKMIWLLDIVFVFFSVSIFKLNINLYIISLAHSCNAVLAQSNSLKFS